MNKIFNIYIALTYTNNSPHIGHLYELIIADVFKKYLSLWYKARLIIGSDDHGTKFKNTAITVNSFPTKISNLNSNKLLANVSRLKIMINDWISTSQKRHIRNICYKFSLIKRIKKLIYKMYYCGWYLPISEVFCSYNVVKFSYNNMFVTNNQPVEWLEEDSIFINYNSIKNKIIAIYRANKIRTPNIKVSTLFKTLVNTKNICISRRKLLSYGIKLNLNSTYYTLWVWIDALFAYSNSWQTNKIHIVGKDIIWFHLTYYVVLLLVFNINLPQYIYQHQHLRYKEVKLSKSLNGRNYNLEKLPRYLICYLLCSRSFSRDIEMNNLDINKTESDLIKNLGNLTKRLSKLIKLHGSKIKRITVSDWLLYLYAKRFEVIIKRYLILFKLNMILNMLMEQLALINNKISNYKLWCNKNVRHKLYIYSHITAYIIFLLKPVIGNKTNIIINKMFHGDWQYMPFKKLNINKT
ncbi:class I tRNA ligase family protein [Candidatus Hodgkinia cicadicola]|uniref:Methionine--tRNA ligase n=1 Tax=Candidatus Hodgkinia cicadicola TaxID=573658 RepID=A0ABX4MGB1_9HYPH|nr:Methionine--tRNA ligase [Candidatus Hodgkinia cicadicola]